MTVRDSVSVPFYCPGAGWMYNGETVTARRAGMLCRKFGIPYRKPSGSDPDAWYLVLETSVAGTCFIDSSDDVISGLSCGDELRMVREDNPHDPLAIALYGPGRKKVGYVPRKENAVIARLMDAGDTFRCIISSEPDTNNVPVSISARRGKKVRRHVSRSFDSLCGSSVWVDAVPAKRDAMQFNPLTENVRELEFDYPLSEDNIWDLSWGYRSRSMDERWNFFMEGRTLYISRSWTGNCIFEVTLSDDGVHKVLVENDRSIYKANNRDSLETLRSLFDSWTSPVCVPERAFPEDIFGNVEVCDGTGYFEADTDEGIVWICRGSGKPLILGKES